MQHEDRVGTRVRLAPPTKVEGRTASPIRPSTHRAATTLVGALFALPFVILLLSTSAVGAPSCDVRTEPSGFALGATDVQISVVAHGDGLRDAGTIKIFADIDYAQKPHLIGQSRGASFGANGSQTVNFSTAGDHHIWVACQAASGNTVTELDIKIIPPGVLFIGGGVIFILILIKAVSGAGQHAPATAAAAPAAAPVPSAPVSVPAAQVTQSAMVVGPLTDTQSPRLLADQPETAQRSHAQRCADATLDRHTLVGLLLRKRAMESDITKEWNQKAGTARALLATYRALCDKKLYTWLATADNVVEGTAATTYKMLSFIKKIDDRYTNIVEFAERQAALSAAARVGAAAAAVTLTTAEAAVELAAKSPADAPTMVGQLGPAEAFKVASSHSLEKVTGELLDRNAEVHGELVRKLADTLSDDIAEYVRLASGHNNLLRLWHAERQVAMNELDREIDAAHRALASSHWDCHGRLLPLDDTALHGANVDLLGPEWRLAVGDPSSLEVPDDVAFRSAR